MELEFAYSGMGTIGFLKLVSYLTRQERKSELKNILLNFDQSLSQTKPQTLF